MVTKAQLTDQVLAILDDQPAGGRYDAVLSRIRAVVEAAAGIEDDRPVANTAVVEVEEVENTEGQTDDEPAEDTPSK